MVMEAEVHAAIGVAVPLPGRLPAWSPVSVRVDDEPDSLVCRQDEYLWVTVPAGVHRVVVEAMLPDATEWEWTFLLRPRRVAIDAPGWTVTGVRPNGVPESQVFFARQQPETAGEAAYDRKDFNAIVAVDRHLEIGLDLAIAQRSDSALDGGQGRFAARALVARRTRADIERGGRERHDRGQAGRRSGSLSLGK